MDIGKYIPEYRTCRKCGSQYELPPLKKRVVGLFKFRWSDLWWIAFLLLLLYSVQAYKSDIDKCRAVIENPCLHCSYENTAKYQENVTFWGPTQEEVDEALKKANFSNYSG